MTGIRPAFVFCPEYEADIGPHVFPTEKYRLVRDRLTADLGLTAGDFVEPAEAARDLLRLVHTDEYLDDFLAGRVTAATVTSELPLTPQIVRWFRMAVGGTVSATRLAMERGAALHLGGGFHHAFADHAEGFCYLNDVAVAARAALGDAGDGVLPERVASVSVVDLDVHQGNGTARIFQKDSRVFTFSMHQENNYPLKERSDLDIGLPDRVEDGDYLQALDRGLERSVLSRKPELVHYVAGADPYRRDQLGGLALSLEGLRERDRRVFRACRETGARVAVTLAGGYAVELRDTVTIHAQTAGEMLDAWPGTE